jgi:hypothetical protein
MVRESEERWIRFIVLRRQINWSIPVKRTVFFHVALVGSRRLHCSDLEAARESSTLVAVLGLHPPHSASAVHDGDFVVVVNAWSSVCCSRKASSSKRLQLCCCSPRFCCQCHASSKVCDLHLADASLNEVW